MYDNTLTPSCFQMEKRRFLSLDINISLKQHKDTYGFHKGDLVEQNPVNIDQRALYSLQLSPRKPTIISFNTQKEIKLIESYTLYKHSSV